MRSFSLRAESQSELPQAELGEFASRHIGPRDHDIAGMLAVLGLGSLDDLIARSVPADLMMAGRLNVGNGLSESEVLAELRTLAGRNQISRSFIGLGYSECVTPPAIRRGILECPGWYTAYTPYQPEISQGRLEALLNFQTMICDLTALPVANASMLDEATSAAEAMLLCRRVQRGERARNRFFVSERCHPQTMEVVKTRAKPLGIEIVIGDHAKCEFESDVFGALVQYPDTDGRIFDYEDFCRRAHANGSLVVVACDPLALTLLRPPGEFGADIAVGSTQRFGVPLGCGGPHAAFTATRDQYKRQLPGRLVGVSRDAAGRPALRLALQTREQHIRRDKATSNICTAQVLLAVIASMYAVFHGPEGLTRIARRIRALTESLASQLRSMGHSVTDGPLFDTIVVRPRGLDPEAIHEAARAQGMNLRACSGGRIGIAVGEQANEQDVALLASMFRCEPISSIASDAREIDGKREPAPIQAPLSRTTSFLSHPVFHSHRSETELMRYMHRLASKDLSLDTSMIPLGSCTMKLNAAAEMLPITWPGFAEIHPFAPREQWPGYETLFERLGSWLADITGFDAVSFMPNSGAQGELTGLLAIRAYQASRGESHRDVCLIPESAHGTNPASAVLAGMNVVVVSCDDNGNIDVADVRKKLDQHSGVVAALMITYPSTHGVFETGIRSLCDLVHAEGAQVYLDGANLNAMVGLCRPGDFGADVCHLNLHKTFCIPHGGGGPGMGPIAVARHLAPHLPGHPMISDGMEDSVGPVSAAPFGSPSILPISYAYIAMMGSAGLRRATEIAILNANYVAARLEPHYKVLYKGESGMVAHECIIDVRPYRKSAGIEVDDIAKRLMDFGFHAPTMSWPVAGTLMIEPTESEAKGELDRFCDAMIAIREEIREIEEGRLPREDNPLKNAPHTSESLAVESWDHPYDRAQAVFPAEWVRDSKFWPATARIDHAYGDRNLVCSCPPIRAYSSD